MLEGTAREVLELLAERPRSPTEVAEELGVSDQTASRQLKRLAEDGYAEETREGEGRGYKRYRMCEFAQVFAGYDGELLEKTVELTPTWRAVLNVTKVPQERYHAPLISFVCGLQEEEKMEQAVGVVVYGSVARGDAASESDIDLLYIYDPEVEYRGEEYRFEFDRSESVNWTPGMTDADTRYLISEQNWTASEFRDGLDAGSQFLRNVLDEGIVLYDPEGVIRNARQERAGESVPQ